MKLTAKLTAKPMDIHGHSGQNGTRNPRLSDVMIRRGRLRRANLRIRNQQAAGSIPAGGFFYALNEAGFL
jgi:hypothetical protein